MSHLSQGTDTQERKVLLEKLEHVDKFVCAHIYSLLFNGLVLLEMKLNRLTGTDSWLLASHSARAEWNSPHRKCKALMTEVKHRAYAVKVTLKKLAVIT